jgi:hypothetical protein
MVITTPRTIYAPKRPDAHCIGGWVGLGSGLNGMENLNPLEFDPRNVQSVTTRYTHYIPAANIYTEHWLNTLGRMC